MNVVRLGDALDPEKNLREWAKRGGENPQKGSPAAAMQWAVRELDRLRAELAAAERSTPTVPARESHPAVVAMISEWYARLDFEERS